MFSELFVAEIKVGGRAMDGGQMMVWAGLGIVMVMAMLRVMGQWRSKHVESLVAESKRQPLPNLAPCYFWLSVIQ